MHYSNKKLGRKGGLIIIKICCQWKKNEILIFIHMIFGVKYEFSCVSCSLLRIITEDNLKNTKLKIKSNAL